MEPASRRTVLRMLSNGLYVMTSRSADRFGAATVTWISQASFRPPLLMAALRRDSNLFRCLRESGSAALHILGSKQQELARRFFAPTEATDGRLNGQPFMPGITAAPVLCDAPAYLECRVRQFVDGPGDHAVLLLEIVEAACRERVRPLTVAESPWEYGG